MEHRHGARIRVSLPVAVTFGHTEMGWFTSQDVGNGGIALNGNIDLPGNCVVELAVEVRKAGRVNTETARAVVVYREGGRIGLMWISRGISLQKLLPEPARLVAA